MWIVQTLMVRGTKWKFVNDGHILFITLAIPKYVHVHLQTTHCNFFFLFNVLDQYQMSLLAYYNGISNAKGTVM